MSSHLFSASPRDLPQPLRASATWITGVLLSALLVAPASAQTSFELTPFLGFQFGGTVEEDFDDDDFDLFDDVDIDESESLGLMLGFNITRNAQLEVLYSLQETNLEESGFFGDDLEDIDIEYLHVGLQWQWTANNRVRPYVVGSLGGTRFSVAQDDDVRPSLSLGGGVKFFFNDHVGLRLDGRFYSTFVEEGDEFDCRRGRRCYRYEDDVTFLQFDAKIGLILAF